MPGQSCDAMRCSIHASTRLRRAAGLPTRRAHVLDQQRQVAQALAQRRQLDAHLGDAEEEVAAEAPGVHLGAEIAPRRREHAHVDRLERAMPPTRLTCFSLRARARACGCSSSGSSPSSSRKSVPPSASASAPLRRSVAPGERALLVAEKDALGERRRDAPAVDDHEGPRRAVAGVVDGLRDELLARAGLAHDENTERRGRDLLEDAEDAPHPRRARRPEARSGRANPTSTRRFACGSMRIFDRPTVSSLGVATMASRTRTRPRNVPLVLPRSLTRIPSLTARSSQWNALTSGSATTIAAPGVPADDERVDVDGELRSRRPSWRRPRRRASALRACESRSSRSRAVYLARDDMGALDVCPGRRDVHPGKADFDQFKIAISAIA